MTVKTTKTTRSTRRRRLLGLFLLAPVAALGTRQPAAAQDEPGAQAAAPGHDWPASRGPHGNGFSPEVPKRLPPKKLLWSRAMAGECHAPVSVGGGYVVVADHGEGRDFWRSFDAGDGTPAWTHEYPNAEKMDFGAAPRAAPLIHRGRVYCLSAWGELFCLKLTTGKVVWQEHLAREFKTKTPTWGFCSSPLVAGGKLIVNPGGSGGPVAALDPSTGEVLWSGQGEGPDYAGFIAGTFGGVEQVVGYDRKTAGGWDLKTGRRLWTFEVDNSYGYIVPSPVAVDGKLLLTSDQQNARLVGFGAGGKIDAEPAAENEDLAPEIATPTVWGDLVLGASYGLVLLDPSPADGGRALKTLWIYDEEECVEGICHVIASEDRALVMCEDGQLLLLALDRESCKVLDRVKLCEETWVHPALAGGRLYVRDAGKLYCYAM